MKNRMFAVAVLAMLTVSSSAFAAGKGTSMLSLGLGQGTADTYAANDLGGLASGTYLAPSTSPETSVGAEYWYMFSDDYALAISGAYGFGSMEWESSDAADPKIKATTSSFKVRVGGDRVGQVGERFLVFMGPGLEYWNGKAKVDVGGAEAESEGVSRFGVSGRIGGFMMLSSGVGIMGQVGHTFGYASVEDGSAKTTWWPGSFEASWGLTFSFGGN